MIRILGEPQRGVVFRLGTFSRVVGPGVAWMVPLLERMVVVDLNEALPGWQDLPRDKLHRRVKHHVLG